MLILCYFGAFKLRSIKLWRLDNLQPQASDLEGLLEYGCNWIRDYLRTNPNVSESDRHLCDDLGDLNQGKADIEAK